MVFLRLGVESAQHRPVDCRAHLSGPPGVAVGEVNQPFTPRRWSAGGRWNRLLKGIPVEVWELRQGIPFGFGHLLPVMP
jgi:hypothetical protein